MKLLPDGALDRLQDGCRIIGSRCNQLGISQWEVVASQSYGHQIDIEGGKISLAGGGGEGAGEKGGIPKHAAPHPSFYQRVHPDWNKDTGEESHYATWKDEPDRHFEKGMYRQDANFYGQEGDYRKKEPKKHKFRNVVFVVYF